MKTKLLLPVAFIIFGMLPAIAVNHTITFDGSLTFSPATLAVQVGDTVTWTGPFSSHPLQSVSVPGGALSFSNATGTTFSYTVEVAGVYDYRCTIHGGLGMAGTFTATDVPTAAPAITAAEVKIFPTLTSGFVTVTLTAQDDLTIEVFNSAGKLISDVKPAAITTAVDFSGFEPGVYFLFVRNNQEIIAESKIVRQ